MNKHFVMTFFFLHKGNNFRATWDFLVLRGGWAPIFRNSNKSVHNFVIFSVMILSWTVPVVCKFYLLFHMFLYWLIGDFFTLRPQPMANLRSDWVEPLDTWVPNIFSSALVLYTKCVVRSRVIMELPCFGLTHVLQQLFGLSRTICSGN
jgi:hypothetical protein